MKKGRIVLGALAVLLLAAGPVEAHKVRLFATVEGKTIKGYGYFSAKSRARDCQVKALGPAGESLGQTQTDEQGEFSLEAGKRVDHRLVLTTGDGHEAEFLIRAEELPADLPGGEGQAAAGKAEETAPAAPAGSRAEEKLSPEAAPAIAQAVAREVAPLKEQIQALRRQVDEYQGRVRFSDAVGGVGFILGLAGVAFYLTARRRGQG